MWTKSLIPLLSIFSLCYSRQFHLDQLRNAACFNIESPTTIAITKTLGQLPLPILLFEYEHRKTIEDLPNFDFLVTDGKLDEYFQFGEFTFANTDNTQYKKSDVLKEFLSYNIEIPGLWCIYSPKIDQYEYRVEIEEKSYYGNYDDIWFSIVNIVTSFVVIQLFYYIRTKRPIIFQAVIMLQLAKVAIFAITAVLAFFDFPIIEYAEYVVASLDDIFTVLFLMGYGFSYSNYNDPSVKKILLLSMLTVIPSFASRYFDFKEDINLLYINMQHYNVVQGILGSDKFDGLSSVERVAKNLRINEYSGPVALLFGFAKLLKIFVIIHAIRQTLKKLTIVNPVARPCFISVVVVWLFLWSFVNAACVPSTLYDYYNVIDYSKTLKQFLLASLRNKYITFLWDESHWFALRFILTLGKGLLVDDGHVVEKKVVKRH
ncbi:hypothetical protein KGF56_001620 [Candida oxycetoniae]|uniref:Intimal thickness related receptor IRP domain-containing protein n=1 Tax=Candida oxycetoniae TaxID=497107 RepID=A0AAI9WYS1_9ASCO|nr:uncharacterized protein KGF56_001620 [Candida oxycetoniae]KAI3405602.2 hypothetical protein KGF56_001620 [Candida oxycetoniae]